MMTLRDFLCSLDMGTNVKIGDVTCMAMDWYMRHNYYYYHPYKNEYVFVDLNLNAKVKHWYNGMNEVVVWLEN